MEPDHPFDVFVNHRGPDVKKTFVKELNEALQSAGVHPFVDVNGIEQGEATWAAILEAIRVAPISICVFSPGYVESKWCLEELAEIHRSPDRKIILPIFWNVKPWHLRRPEVGPFAQALQKLQSRHEAETVTEWRRWLAGTADIYGYEFDDSSGSESNLVVQAVVSKVLQHLKSLFPVALDDQATSLISKIHAHPTTPCKLGIFGMGGIGKTTLAKHIFKRMKDSFPSSSFLEDVAREASKGEQGILSLQLQLLKDITNNNTSSSSSSSTDPVDVNDTRSTLQHCLQTKRSLIILDNVDSPDSIDALCVYSHLGHGSICIITSRDEHLCSVFSDFNPHEMPFLKPMEARQLFCWHAFGSIFPAREFQALAGEVARACGGHPLTLEIMGSLLKRESDLLVWDAVLCHLREHDSLQNHEKLLQRLRISFDSLEPRHRDMFLDVACFLVGREARLGKEVWASLGWGAEVGVRNLVRKSLVKIESGLLGMHDILIDLGRSIVTSEAVVRPGKRSRLWMSESEEELLDNQVTDKVETFDIGESKADLSHQNLQAMENLRLLNMDGCSGTQIQFPRVLRYVRWQRLPSEHLPCEMYDMRKLVALDLTSSKITRLCNANSSVMFPRLQTLILDGCKALKTLPDSINASKELRTLHLESCASLQSLPETIGSLSKLEVLKLRGCTELTHLPKSLGCLTNLSTLFLTDCTNLVSLPNSLGNCQNLSNLWLGRCYNLEAIPESTAKLFNLLTFESSFCDKITHFPEPMKDLFLLKTLKIGGHGLKTLPAFVTHLTQLQELSITLSKFLTLPSGVSALTKLQKLNLVGCDVLETLPESMGAFQELKTLWLVGCTSLKRLPDSVSELQNLEDINLSCCESLQNLPSNFTKLTKLRVLGLEGCVRLTEFPDPSSIPETGCSLILYNFLVSRCLRHLEQGKLSTTEEDLSLLMKFNVQGDDPKLLQIQGFLDEMRRRKGRLDESMDVAAVREQALQWVVQNDMPRALEYINRIVELEPESEVSYLTRFTARLIVNDERGSREDSASMGECVVKRKAKGVRLAEEVLEKVERFREVFVRDWKGALLTLLDSGANAETGPLLQNANSESGPAFPGTQEALAKRTWKETHDPQPEKAAALRNQALLKFELDDFYSAVHLLEASKSLDPLNVSTLSLLGRAKYRTGDFSGAETAFSQALAVDSKHEETLFHRGMLRESVFPFDLRGALEDYDKAVEVSPFNCALFLRARAKVKFKLGDLDGAGEDLDRSYVMYPYAQTLRFQEGLRKWREGEFEGALVDFEVAYNFLPNPCVLRYKDQNLVEPLSRKEDDDGSKVL